VKREDLEELSQQSRTLFESECSAMEGKRRIQLHSVRASRRVCICIYLGRYSELVPVCPPYLRPIYFHNNFLTLGYRVAT
jgi:hypothetical protein